MIAAEALPWATNSLNWKNGELERADTPSISAYILARLRGDILSAYFRPGEKLYLKVLASRYGTGIAPIREALAVLSGAGLVVAESQRGFRVAPASKADFIDVADLRQEMEAIALEKSIMRGGDKWASDVCRVYYTFSAVSTKAGCNDPITDAWESHHREFHFALISSCGSPALLNFCSQLHDRFDRYRRLTLPNSSYMSVTAGDHEEIKDAAIRRDAKMAVHLIGKHIQTITDIVLDHYK